MLAKEVPSSLRVLTGTYSSLPTGLYNPKAFITHAASLRQTFVHCARFPTAASRRSLDRVSVPVWLIILSDQLPVLGLVGFYPANYLMGRRLIPKREVLRSSALTSVSFETVVLCCISSPFGGLSRSSGQVPHVILTRSPLGLPRYCYRMDLVRLACVRHAASVRPEPGSNSPSRIVSTPLGL